MSRSESMNYGVCTVSVDIQPHYLIIRVTTVYLASRDLHARRDERTVCVKNSREALTEVAEFLGSFPPIPASDWPGRS
jgi:hypothetical protein